MKSIGSFERDKFTSIIKQQFHTPSFSDAREEPQSRMLSWHLGMVIQSQIPTKFIPIRPESNMKSVNTKMEFQLHHAVFRQVPCLVSKKTLFLVFSRTILDFFIHFRHAFYQWPNKLWVKGWCMCSLQCFDHVCNLIFVICHCLKTFHKFLKK